MREKVDPYLRPIYDALFDLMDARIVERAMQSGEIEIAPLAFMRGRTLANAVVILDEAQNTTSMQMKMFLTRLGENSRMIVTGDPSQTDLPPGQTSGLSEAIRLLADVEGIGHVAFTADDVVRHELVARIVQAYDKARPRRQSARPANDDMRVPAIDVIVEAPAWDAGAEATVRRALAEAAAAIGADFRNHALAVLLTDDAAIRRLNAQWRGIDKPTNVLSFPPAPRLRRRWHEVARRHRDRVRDHRARSADEDKPFADHLAHLACMDFST